MAKDKIKKPAKLDSAFKKPRDNPPAEDPHNEDEPQTGISIEINDDGADNDDRTDSGN